MSLERCPTCHRAYKQDRSNSQNRYYWGVVIKLLSDHISYDTSDTHEILKHKFLKSWATIKNKKGQETTFEITKSTTGLTTKEFEEFMTQVRQWASIELGLWIPEPNEAPMQE